MTQRKTLIHWVQYNYDIINLFSPYSATQVCNNPLKTASSPSCTLAVLIYRQVNNHKILMKFTQRVHLLWPLPTPGLRKKMRLIKLYGRFSFLKLNLCNWLTDHFLGRSTLFCRHNILGTEYSFQVPTLWLWACYNIHCEFETGDFELYGIKHVGLAEWISLKGKLKILTQFVVKPDHCMAMYRLFWNGWQGRQKGNLLPGIKRLSRVLHWQSLRKKNYIFFPVSPYLVA